MSYRNFDQPILAKVGVYKWKPLSAFSFRQLHRALIEFHDYELQQRCCNLAGVQSVKDELSFGYCCVDEKFGLQIHMLGAANRDGRTDWWVSVPEGKEIVLSYQDAKDRMISLSDSHPEAIKQCLPRCRALMERHEKNPTIMLEELDKFRIIEFPLDLQITIPVDGETRERVLFRPIAKKFGGLLRGHLVSEPQINTGLHKGDALDVELVWDETGREIEIVPKVWFELKNIGGVGSENGIILKDEEYAGMCRITLEDCGDRFAITCGIYGAMVHTVFPGKNDVYAVYEAMKEDLRFICDTYDPDALDDEECEDEFHRSIMGFVRKYY